MARLRNVAMMTVHPHARGDGARVFGGRFVRLRFTPTCVGTATITPPPWRPSRFTPTRVGTASMAGAAPTVAPPVHPHARGDGAGTKRRRRAGSRFTPTRVGTAARWRPARRRFTPTCVGTATTSERSPPRAWGRRVSTARPRTGSPPRAWGRHRGVRGSPPRAWGRRPKRRSACGSPPRAWGRYGSPPPAWGRRRPRCARLPRPIGSPPRAWGRRVVVDGRLGCRRFTPTRVGTARHPTTKQGSPRSRFTPTRVGTATAAPDAVRPSDGSPPPAWGRRDAGRCSTASGENRFTPTRVGTALKESCPCRDPSVHPHARGDGGVELLFLAQVQRFTPTRVGTAVHQPSTGPRLFSVSPPRAWGRHCLGLLPTSF